MHRTQRLCPMKWIGVLALVVAGFYCTPVGATTVTLLDSGIEDAAWPVDWSGLGNSVGDAYWYPLEMTGDIAAHGGSKTFHYHCDGGTGQAGVAAWASNVNVGNVTLRFWMLHDNIVNDSDNVKVMYFNGSSYVAYTTIQRYRADVSGNTWLQHEVRLSAADYYPGRYVMFQGNSTGATDMYFDDVVVTGDLDEVSPEAGTVGTVLTLRNMSGFGAPGGRVNLVEMDPAPGVPPTVTALKVLTWSDIAVTALVGKMPKSGMGEYHVEWIEATKGSTPQQLGETFTFSPLEVTTIDPSSGAIGDLVTITGKYFGTKRGAVLMHSPPPLAPGLFRASTVATVKCKVVSWTMDPATGDSTAQVTFTKALPGSYDVVVDNKISSNEVEGGFTVVAPE